MAGYQCATWLVLFNQSYSRLGTDFMFNGYPDGRPLMEQDNVLVEIFGLIRDVTLDTITTMRNEQANFKR